MHKIVEFAEKRLGVKLYPGQAQALSEYYESGAPHWLLLAGRRGGKSLLSDVIAIYEATVSDLTGMLRENETRFILILSTRIENSSLHIRNISKLLRHDKQLARLIIRETVDTLELANNVNVLSLPASARTARGFTASCVILDELAFFVDSRGNASADQVYTAIEPTIATFGHRGRIIITTSVNARSGICYDLFERSQSGELSDYWVTRADSRSLNPRVSERTIRNALARDGESARAEYYAEFRDPLEAYLSTEAIEACVDPRASETQKATSGRVYVMAIDPATQRDRYGFVVMHSEQGLYHLDYAHIIKPPVNPEAAEELLFSLVKRYNPRVVRVDTASTYQRLKSKLPALKYDPFTRPLKLAIYGSLKEALNLGKVVLYDHKDLLAELKALVIRNGVDIAAPRSGSVTHDDLSDCLALCVEALASGHYSNNIGWLPDPTQVWWVDDPQNEWDERDNQTICEWEFQAEKPYGSHWHIKTEHREGETAATCKKRKEHYGYCLACKHQYEQDGTYEAQENDPTLQEGYTSQWNEIVRAREDRARIADDTRARENEFIKKYWRKVRK